MTCPGTASLGPSRHHCCRVWRAPEPFKACTAKSAKLGRGHRRAAERTAHTERITINVTPLTPETFRPFGQVIEATDDGKQFDEADAQLVLDKGTPRFYIMRIPRTGLQFSDITFHRDVTQCLGAVTHKPWYMAVAAPGVSPHPCEADISVFQVPPTVFLKLECGTWHAGPLFADSEFMDFYNLELSDTNIVDHTTHCYSREGVCFEIIDG